MADKDLEIGIKVKAETGAIDAVSDKFKKVDEAIKGATKSTEEANKTNQTFKGNMLEMAGAFGIATTAVEALKWGFRTMSDFVQDSIKEAVEYEEAMHGIRRAVELAGGAWADSSAEIEAWGNMMEKTTKYSDDKAITALDKMTRILGNVKMAMGAVALATDMSASSHQDLNASLELLTNLFNGNTRGLMEAKKQFGDLLQGVDTTSEAIRILYANLDGLAKKESGTATETEKLKNKIDGIKQSFGEMLTSIGTPILKAVNDNFEKIVDTFKTLFVVVSNISPSVSSVVGILSKYVGKTVDSTSATKDATTAHNEEAEALARKIAKMKEEEAEKARQDALDAERKAREDSLNSSPLLGPSMEDYQKAEQSKQEANAKMEQLESDANIKLLALAENTYQNRMSLLEAQRAREKKAVNDSIADESKKQATIKAIDDKYNAIALNTTKLTSKEKTALAMDTASTAIEALQTLNSMEDIKSKNDARRTKLLLALQQSIAIGWAWAKAMETGGPFAVGLAVATTGLIVAQFASQSKAIDKARASNNAESSTMQTNTVDIGGGSSIVTENGTSISGGGGSGGGGGSYGTSSGGGGGGAIINVGGVVVNFSADNLDLNSVDVVARRLGEAVKRGTTEAVQMAIAVYTSGEKNSGVAR